jgi:alpha-ketoglutarate-dependent taurine dioxygenase
VTYETVPSDYACLQIRTVPETGGDTMWASAYEAYDRLSPAMQVFLEGLTATHVGRVFLDIATKLQLPVREPRGSPLNVGQDLKSSHPVIRTHPITGWRGLFVNKEFTTRINEVSKTESDMLLEYLFRVVALNQNLQVRFHWEPNSLAIWDNRCTWHAITFDVDNVKREGSRALSLGEQPFFDPKSVSRQTALAAQAKAAAAA